MAGKPERAQVDYTQFIPKEKLTHPSEGKFNRIRDIFFDNQDNDYILEEQAEIFSPEGRV